MATYDDLVPGVAIHISPCPEKVLIDAIKSAVRDFCKRTKLWVYDCPEFESDEIQSIYELNLPLNTRVVNVWGLEGRTGEYKDKTDYFIDADGRLRFNKPIGVKKIIKPLVSLMPGLKSTEFPDYFIDYFSEHIISKAVADLQVQPFRAWSQPSAAVIHLQMYDMGIIEAKRFRDDGLNKSKARTRVRPNYL